MKINEKSLSIFATTPPYDFEGFLNKRGEVNKAFQRRYFVLKGNLLFYFEKKGDREPLGLIIVEGCLIELSGECDQYCFEITFEEDRTYVLAAESQESMEAWMKVLTCAGYEYKKLMISYLQRQLEEIEDSRNKISAEVSSTTAFAPKPPPRRQNPFNRPAPPLPTIDNINAATVTPFINAHFGSTAQRMHNLGGTHLTDETGTKSLMELEPKGHNKDNSKHAPQYQLQPKGHNKDSSKHAPQYQQVPDTSTVFYCNPGEDNLRKRNAANFESMHEKYRLEVMKDVEEYHLRQKLVDL